MVSPSVLAPPGCAPLHLLRWMRLGIRWPRLSLGVKIGLPLLLLTLGALAPVAIVYRWLDEASTAAQVVRLATRQRWLAERLADQARLTADDAEARRAMREAVVALGNGLHETASRAGKSGSSPGDLRVLGEEWAELRRALVGLANQPADAMARQDAGETLAAALPALTARLEGVVAEAERRSAERERRTKAVLLGIAGFDLLLLGGLLCHLRFRVTRPLGEIERGALRIESGDLSHRISIHTQDELGNLARSLGSMAAALARDRRAARRLEEERTRRTYQQQAIADLGQRALAGTDLDALLEEATHLIRENLAVEHSAVFELLPGAQSLLLRAGTGWTQGLVGRAQLTADAGSHLELALRECEPLQALGLGTSFPDCPLFAAHRVVSGMTVAIHHEGHPFGLLGAYGERPRRFGAEDMHFLQAMANLLAVAIERRQTTEALGRKSRELERSNADLEQFAYVASHDLREPLRTVSAFSKLLARRYQGRLDAEADEFLGFVLSAAARMEGLIEALLAYSRAGSPLRELSLTSCEAVLNDTLVNLQAAISESGAIVTHDALPTIMADATQLGQLFQNLIGNAIKFRHDAPPRVHVSARRVSGEPVPRRDSDAGARGWWIFSVRDEGIGLAPDHADRIFEMFERVHDKSIYRGSGIGLAVCKKIVERYGGRIWVESRPGRGSTFHFTLPEG